MLSSFSSGRFPIPAGMLDTLIHSHPPVFQRDDPVSITEHPGIVSDDYRHAIGLPGHIPD